MRLSSDITNRWHLDGRGWHRRKLSESCGPPSSTSPDQRAGNAPGRRSASFMLSPNSGAGRMSPVLAHASELAVASAAAATQLRTDSCSTDPCTGLPAVWGSSASERALPCKGPDEAVAAVSSAPYFLSLSLTTQWLQAGCPLQWPLSNCRHLRAVRAETHGMMGCSCLHDVGA